ncbi:MAG: acyl-CoA thioesterase [Deltaproteobacteria bacterium]|nr:acyl-CoA thioesterase [Deltaproteobacteria bacterium]MBW2673851.1 acyl-CoA thioesterase [Deltaproteobacteria bacterium]
MGVVYYANYLKWFEVGRSELMREMDIVYSELEASGYYLPVVEVSCHYLLPAKYDEIVVIETEITAIRRASVRFDYVIHDERKERILAEGFTLHPFTSKEGKIVRAPKHIADKINGDQ